MIPLAFVLLVAAPADGGLPVPRLPVALHASAEALTFTIGTTRLSPLPVQRDARGGLDVRQLRDKLHELAAQQPDVHAITLHREPNLSVDDVRRLTEACVAEGFQQVDVRVGPPVEPMPAASTPAAPATKQMIVFGSIDAAEVRRVIEQQRTKTDECVRLARTRTPAIEGRVDVKFIISPAGSVSSAQVAVSTVTDSELGSCLTSVIRACTFPKPKGGGVGIVTYPFAVPRRAR